LLGARGRHGDDGQRGSGGDDRQVSSEGLHMKLREVNSDLISEGLSLVFKPGCARNLHCACRLLIHFDSNAGAVGNLHMAVGDDLAFLHETFPEIEFIDPPIGARTRVAEYEYFRSGGVTERLNGIGAMAVSFRRLTRN